MITTKFKSFIGVTTSTLVTLTLSTAPVLAAGDTTGLSEAAEAAYGSGKVPTADIVTVIASVISILLGFMGVVLLLLFLYAGFLWMTAMGDKAKVEKARNMISQAVIGMIIVMASYALSTEVVKQVLFATNVTTKS